MIFFSWNSAMETGIQIIDAQHQEIAIHANDVYQAASLERRSEEEAAMSVLVESITTHLILEEELLEAAGFPGLAAHKRLDVEFRQGLEHYYDVFLEGNDISLALIADLRKWLTSHISNAEYVPFLLQQLVPETKR